MKIRSVVYSLTMLLPAGVVFFLMNSGYFVHLVLTLQLHQLEYALFLLGFTILAVVYAPLNSGLMTLGSIPVLGWQLACSINMLGSVIGSAIAYLMARQFGLRLIKKVFGADVYSQITNIKINQKRSFEWVFVSRSLSSTFSDWICYAAGIFKIPINTFIFASILSQLVIAIPLFYLYHLGVESGKSKYLFLLILVGLLLLYKVRHRYFEKIE